VNFVFTDYAVQKNALIILDMLANFEWKRPIYFAITTGDDAYMGLQPYFQMEGLAYRLMPYYCGSIDDMVGRVNTSVMYDNVMNKFKWGNMQRRGVYLDENNRRLGMNMRNTFSRLAYALAYEHKMDSAVKVCDKCLEVMPDYSMPYDKMLIPLVDVYFQAGKAQKAAELGNLIIDRYEQELYYFNRFTGADAAYLGSDIKEAVEVIKTLGEMSQNYKQPTLYKRALDIFNTFKIK
jgi:tetratricopeptide (TPR) repeat protein